MSGGEGLVGIVFFLTLFGTTFGIAYFYYTTRNRERLALIEKGADASIFKTEPVNLFKNFALKFGMLLAGSGLGVLIGEILANTTELSTGGAYFSMIFLFAGLALILSHFISRKLKD